MDSDQHYRICDETCNSHTPSQDLVLANDGLVFLNCIPDLHWRPRRSRDRKRHLGETDTARGLAIEPRDRVSVKWVGLGVPSPDTSAETQ